VQAGSSEVTSDASFCFGSAPNVAFGFRLEGFLAHRRPHRRDSDVLIGATALVRDLTVVTRDRKDFQRFSGLDVRTPWRRRTRPWRNDRCVVTERACAVDRSHSIVVRASDDVGMMIA